jgi:hypothetical protein
MSNAEHRQDVTGPGNAGEPPARAQLMLIEFLREHDAACPVCGYNLRALTRPTCPECRQDLSLTVCAARLRVGWLFAAVAPGFFSGIAACLLLVPLVILHGRVGRPPLVFYALDAFGWLSAVFAIMLITRRVRFIAQRPAHQALAAAAIWLIHIAALLGFMMYASYML